MKNLDIFTAGFMFALTLVNIRDGALAIAGAFIMMSVIHLLCAAYLTQEKD